MYLSDEEIQVLMKKMLSWLSVGGYLFFRESCYHQSGNKKRGNNPTEYRTPMHYVELCESVEQEDDSNPGISYVFQAIFGRSIEAYITVCILIASIVSWFGTILKRTTSAGRHISHSPTHKIATLAQTSENCQIYNSLLNAPLIKSIYILVI